MAYLKHNEGRETKKPKGKPPQETPAEHPHERLEGAARYGRFYWCVKTDLSDDGEIYVYADEVRHLPTGGLVFVSLRDEREQTNLALANGQWTAVFAAGCWDGHAVAVEHWKGEIQR